MGSHLIPGAHDLIASTIGMQASWYFQFVLTTLVLFIPGIRFFEKGLPALCEEPAPPGKNNQLGFVIRSEKR